MNDKLPTIKQIIAALNLKPLPREGGWFIQSYLSDEYIDAPCLPPRYSRRKAFGSVIYYLLTDEADSFSALHKLTTDETWHFYLGDPAELLLLYPDGRGERVTLGNDILNGERLQSHVPKNVWQGGRLRGELQKRTGYSLMGTTMAPAFDPEDFQLGNRKKLIKEYPGFAREIESLTRT